ncbi:permease of the major facilitator superfamily [Aspergillus steynii IBT 23096]|uniref:Permease of the major facilitator superfamily n=1 Tax=Aspergillus steynii IBT 23096 TaxID=1392250 RepID=A0A2I2GKT9_9EURO|nr:permease of the major facilitator superfamily [Aspergillus steynii IBT 23096]PLB53498.1 permease of the major facilitator superfamily [Aspergillus steynii IBT 23096]
MDRTQDDCKIDQVELADTVKHTEGLSTGDMLATYSPAEQKKALRKLDWNMISLLGVLYMLSYIDRGNLGNAYTAGMGSDWGITSDQYSWIITAYYLAYIAFHWFVLLWKLVSLPMWVALMAFGWGAASILQAATTNFAGIIVLRCLIGAFEAGFAPGVALFLSFFYHRSEMGLRYGLFISFSPIANCFASALAYGIVQADAGLAQWQLLFIIEGIPTILIAPLAYMFLPRGPGECRLLTDRENEIVRLRALKARGHETKGELNLKQVVAAFTDYKNYFQAVIIFCLNAAFAALPAFLPTIIEDIGYTSIQAQGFSAPPYLASYFVCLAASFLSDRVGNRSYFLSALSCVGAVGYLLQALLKTGGVRYFATYLICGCVFPAVALTFTWVTDNQGSASKRGARLVIFGMLGQTGSIAGSRFFPKEEGPFYVKGMAISASLLFFAAIVAQALRFLMWRENKRRDALHGVVDTDEMPEDVVNSGDDHPSFRFIL